MSGRVITKREADIVEAIINLGQDAAMVIAQCVMIALIIDTVGKSGKREDIEAGATAIRDDIINSVRMTQLNLMGIGPTA